MSKNNELTKVYERQADGTIKLASQLSPPDNNNSELGGEDIGKLFVYGIFLDEYMRSQYGMSNPAYAVVDNFATRHLGSGIVEAVEDSKYALTGLIVSVAPVIEFGSLGSMNSWDRLDRLEGGYDRIKVITTDGDTCWMYVAK